MYNSEYKYKWVLSFGKPVTLNNIRPAGLSLQITWNLCYSVGNLSLGSSVYPSQAFTVVCVLHTITSMLLALNQAVSMLAYTGTHAFAT